MGETNAIQSFDDILGHQAILEALELAFQKGRPHHAYLFTGPPGTGKRTIAEVLGRSLICQKGSIGRPCNRCPDCLRIAAAAHPDWTYIPNDKANIGIEVIRQLSHEWSFRSFEGGARFALIDDADRLTPEAANALLKLLEEPPEGSTFFLITANRTQLLPTIVSRCQHVPFSPLSPEQVQEVLNRLEVDSPLLESASMYAGGSPGRALQLIEDPVFQRHRELFSQFMELSFKGTGSVLAFGDWAELGGEETRATGGKLAQQRNTLRSILDLLRLLMRDLSLIRAGAPEEYLLSDALSDVDAYLARQLTWTGVSAILEALREAERATMGNVSPRLILENLAVSISSSATAA